MSTPEVARNARLEAQAVVGDGYDARVLEPSPPAVLDDDVFADDPVAIEEARPGTRDQPGSRWRPHVAGLARRTSGPCRVGGGVGSAPTRVWRRHRRPLATRAALHRVAVYVVSPSRRRANSKIGLRYARGGFGTPFFAGARGDEQLRVVGAELIRQAGDSVSVEPISTLNQASALALDGPPDVAWAEGFDVPAPGDLDEPLTIDPSAAQFLGQWIGFAWSVLEEVRSDVASIEPSRVQLWPEHFDAAFDCLAGGSRRGVTFGASPGDAGVDEPYLYVLPADFDAVAPSDLWNAQGFDGAVLPLSDLVDEPDQRAAALTFFRDRRLVVGDA